MCGSKGRFQVEDLPVCPRWFCCEKCYAEYVGLPVMESGYYGFEAEDKKISRMEKIGQAIVDDFCDNFNIGYWTEKGRGRDYGFASLDLYMGA